MILFAVKLLMLNLSSWADTLKHKDTTHTKAANQSFTIDLVDSKNYKQLDINSKPYFRGNFYLFMKPN